MGPIAIGMNTGCTAVWRPGMADEVHIRFAEVLPCQCLANPDAAGLLDLADVTLDAEVGGDWIEA